MEGVKWAIKGTICNGFTAVEMRQFRSISNETKRGPLARRHYFQLSWKRSRTRSDDDRVSGRTATTTCRSHRMMRETTNATTKPLTQVIQLLNVRPRYFIDWRANEMFECCTSSIQTWYEYAFHAFNQLFGDSLLYELCFSAGPARRRFCGEWSHRPRHPRTVWTGDWRQGFVAKFKGNPIQKNLKICEKKEKKCSFVLSGAAFRFADALNFDFPWEDP